MNLEKKIHRYYEENKISPTNFHCEHRDLCAAGCKRFVGGKEPFIGSRYELTSPRLLFLSLDAGEMDKNHGRTVSQIQEWAENFDVSGKHKLRHWRVTHEMAIEFLKDAKHSLTLNTVAPYFAHTNSAKCCQNKRAKAQADPKLFRNCRRYIPGEIEALDPDVLITQGRYAFDAVQHAIVEGRIDATQTMTWEAAKRGAHGVLAFGKKRVLWFATPHPGARGGIFQSQKRHWKKWVSLVHNRFSASVPG